MIINAPTLQLTRPEQFTLNNPLVGYRNAVAFSTLTAGSAAAGFPVTNLANPATHLKWRASAVGDVVVDTTVPGGTAVDYIGIARHNFGTAAVGITVKGATALDGGGLPVFSITLIPETFLEADTPAIFRFNRRTDLIAVRLELAEGFVAPECAVLFVGELLVMERRIYVGHTPITMGRQIEVSSAMSESGQFLGRTINNETRQSSISMTNLTPDWVRAYLDPFLAVAAVQPFFFAWRPKSYPEEVGFTWTRSNPRPVNALGNGLMSVDIEIGGVS